MNTDFAKNAARKLVAVVRHSPRIVAVIGVGIGCAWLFTPRPDVSRQAAEEVLAAVRAWPEDRGNINAASSRRACKRLKDGIFVSGLGMINNVDRRGNLTEGLYIGLDYEKVCFAQKKFS